MRYSFQAWEMVDADTCCARKLLVMQRLHQYLFTEPNKLLQKPIRGLLDKLGNHLSQKRFGRGEVPDLDIDGWMEECDKEIRAQVSCVS